MKNKKQKPTRKSCKICVHYIGKKTSTTPKYNGGYSFHRHKFCRAINMKIHSTENALNCTYFTLKENTTFAEPKKTIKRRKSCSKCLNFEEGYDHSRNSKIYNCKFSDDQLSIASKRYCDNYKLKNKNHVKN